MNFLQSALRALFYIAIGAAISLAGAATFFMSWEPDRDDYPIRGIDISHHQGEIDWVEVARDDVSFAYMKASEGEDFRDGAFERNWKSAGQAGVPRGAYHYFNLCKTGKKQAENFLSVLPSDPDMLAPMLDLEFGSNCLRRPPVEEVHREISEFVRLVEAARGKQVVFYAPEDFYIAYLKDRGLNRRLWTRSIWRSPSYAQDWTLWQYHNRGNVKGIAGDVDLNVLVNEQQLADLRK